MGRWGRLGAVVLLIGVYVAVPAHAAAPTYGAPTALTVDDQPAPLGVGLTDVSFGWHLGDTRPDAVQTAYRIVVTRSRSTVWDSGRVASHDQAFVAYAGPPLAPDTTYHWIVETWDGAGVASPRSRAATFDTGLRDSDWHADWIKRLTYEIPDPSWLFNLQSEFGVWLTRDEYTYVRKVATLSLSPIVRARAYISADQQYELYVNGAMVGKGEAYQYPDSQYYETWDIGRELHPGVANAFGIIYSWQGPAKGHAEGTPGVIARITVLHANGALDVITTDGTWEVLPGDWLPGTQRDEEGDPVGYTENIDGLLEPVGWDTPSFVPLGWLPATVIGEHPTAPWTHLVSTVTRIVYTPIHPVSLKRLSSGAVVADFGAIYAGIPSVVFHHGLPGALITMHGGDLLDEPEGDVSVTHGTQHTDMSYTYLERLGPQTFRAFGYLGFRYFQIDDPGETLTRDDVVLLARHTNVPSVAAGTFSSSDPTVDAVFALGVHSALYTMQEQFVDTPTREQGSWLWDGRNESQTAMAAFGDINLTRKDLLEFAQSQQRFWPSGAINKIYPTSLGAQQIPQFTEIYVDWVWQYWMHSGDRVLLAQLYPVVAKVAGFLAGFIDPHTGLITNISGATDESRYPTDTQINLLAVNVFRRVAAIASALGDSPALEQQREASLVDAINHHLVLPDGLYTDGLNSSGAMVATSSQTTDAFALEFGVVPPLRVASVTSAVVATNMSSPPMSAGDLLEALRVTGQPAAVLHLVTDAKEPGWANILARGGTFTWEVWNPQDTDVPLLSPLASFYPGDSMSHGWGSNVVVGIQQTLLGVVPTSPGFATFSVSPPVVALTHAAGTVPTPYGPIDVSWTRGSTMQVTVTVPPGTTAVVHLPGGGADTLGSGTTTVTA